MVLIRCAILLFALCLLGYAIYDWSRQEDVRESEHSVQRQTERYRHRLDSKGKETWTEQERMLDKAIRDAEKAMKRDER